MMKVLLITWMLFVCCNISFATDLTYIVDFYPGSGDLYESIYLVDTETNDVGAIYTQPDRVRQSEDRVYRDIYGGAPGSIASGPDGKIYFSTGKSVQEHRWDETENQWILTSYEKFVYIKRFSLPTSSEPDPEVETVYELPEDTPVYDLDVRSLDSGGIRVYFSTGATGAGGTGEIYYFDDDGDPVLYYTLDSSEIGVATCGGEEVGYWGGNFDFDDSGNRLYLSSGNHIPAAIFMIDGALPDGLSESSTVTKVYDHNCSISGFEVARDGIIYFTELGNTIHRLDLGESPESPDSDVIAYESPTANRICDVALPIMVLEMSRLPVITGFRLPGQSSNTLNVSRQGIITDVSKYEPIPELYVPGPFVKK